MINTKKMRGYILRLKIKEQDTQREVCVKSASTPIEGKSLTFNSQDSHRTYGLDERGWTEESVRPFLGEYIVERVNHDVVMGDLWRLESRVTVEAIKKEE